MRQQTIHPVPGDGAVAIAAAQPFPPEPEGPTPEPLPRIRVARDPGIREVAPTLLTQRPVLIGQSAMAVLGEPLRRAFSPRLSRLLEVFRFTTQ